MVIIRHPNSGPTFLVDAGHDERQSQLNHNQTDIRIKRVPRRVGVLQHPKKRTHQPQTPRGRKTAPLTTQLTRLTIPHKFSIKGPSPSLSHKLNEVG